MKIQSEGQKGHDVIQAQLQHEVCELGSSWHKGFGRARSQLLLWGSQGFFELLAPNNLPKWMDNMSRTVSLPSVHNFFFPYPSEMLSELVLLLVFQETASDSRRIQNDWKNIEMKNEMLF